MAEPFPSFRQGMFKKFLNGYLDFTQNYFGNFLLELPGTK